MKKFLLLTLLASSFCLKAQISTFDIERSTLVYINYMPGEPGYEYDYNYAYDFADQLNDLLEIGVILPVWKKLNANVGLGATFNFQEPELWSDSYDYVSSTVGKGVHLKTGLSYSLAIGDFKILPNVGMVLNTEADYSSYSPGGSAGNPGPIYLDGTYLWAVLDVGIDFVYKDFLIGLTYTDPWWYYDNYANVGFKLGYAFKKKSKMNF